ncbi:MAG: hypothetical protein QXN62_06415 [Candidatus Bathyarchaeia archaeon]
MNIIRQLSLGSRCLRVLSLRPKNNPSNNTPAHIYPNPTSIPSRVKTLIMRVPIEATMAIIDTIPNLPRRDAATTIRNHPIT